MMPWGAWLYLLLVAAVGAAHFAVEWRAGGNRSRAALRLAAVAVIGAGVVLFYRGSGAGTLYMLALFLSALLIARKSVEDAQAARERAPETPAPPPWLGLTRLLLLPAIGWGAMAVWTQQHA
ncbi:hypothetical protein LDO32_12035 [Luteimonas sp. Y-2-2-4F]|nr:hypothetical protein [Luteimonas sp. Y-2-2-4F]MCD9032455.1 hypothetical protein [Luteimonas sp. Y-2-2-4F]